MVKGLLNRIKIFLSAYLGEKNSRRRRGLHFISRLGISLYRDFSQGPIRLHAMSLVYTSLLSIVPLLALSFSLMRAFDVHMQIEPVLLKFLEPLGAKGEEITAQIINFVDNVKVGVLSTVGLVLLLYSAVAMIQKVELAFNSIWQLRNNRSLMRRLSDYLSVFMVGPLLVFAALALSGSLMSHSVMQGLLSIEPFGALYRLLAQSIPYMLVIAAFTFLYIFIPNTRVHFRPALIGGIVSGILWQSASLLFATFVVSSARYTAIYSGFAILFVFMIWMYINWVIILLGADLVFYLQHRENLKSGKAESQLSILETERAAVVMLLVIGRYYYAGKGGISYEKLIVEMDLPGRFIIGLIDLLKQAGLIIETMQEDILTYQPARPMEETSLREVLQIIRGTNGLNETIGGKDAVKFDALLEKIEESLSRELASVSLKDLLVLPEKSSRQKNIHHRGKL